MSSRFTSPSDEYTVPCVVCDEDLPIEHDMYCEDCDDYYCSDHMGKHEHRARCSECKAAPIVYEECMVCDSSICKQCARYCRRCQGHVCGECTCKHLN